MTSLRVRFLFCAALILALFSLATGLLLRTSFQSSIEDRAREQLKLQIYGLLAAAEYRDGQLRLPDQLSDPRFNRLVSGLSALLLQDGRLIGFSRSYLSQADLAADIPGAGTGQPGDWQFTRIRSTDSQSWYQLSFTVLWEEAGDNRLFTFLVRESDQPYVAQIESFENTLWMGLGILVIAAIVLVFILLNLGFAPFRKLASELQRIETGEQNELRNPYPSEVLPVVRNLNRLIAHERQLRERYRHRLGDLAHSLKTPLAVLKGVQAKEQDAQENEVIVRQQVQRMDDIVSYQLRRAISAVPGVNTRGTQILTLYSRLQDVLQRVYSDKNIVFKQQIRPGIRLPWDDADGLEVLGNLMDNACKYGAGEVLVKSWIADGNIWLTVDDNGPGIKPEHYHQVLCRGGRLDEQQAGQGIGLAVVRDIVEATNGSLSLEASALGGVSVVLSLPLFR